MVDTIAIVALSLAIILLARRQARLEGWVKHRMGDMIKASVTAAVNDIRRRELGLPLDGERRH